MWKAAWGNCPRTRICPATCCEGGVQRRKRAALPPFFWAQGPGKGDRGCVFALPRETSRVVLRVGHFSLRFPRSGWGKSLVPRSHSGPDWGRAAGSGQRATEARNVAGCDAPCSSGMRPLSLPASAPTGAGLFWWVGPRVRPGAPLCGPGPRRPGGRRIRRFPGRAGGPPAPGAGVR